MPAQALPVDAESLLNHAAKHLARDRASLAEAWRFPLLDAHEAGEAGTAANRVTFVYPAFGPYHVGDPPRSVQVLGTFHALHDPLPLEPVSFLGTPTGYWGASFAIPTAQVHFYRMVVEGVPRLDPVNPQRAAFDDGTTWSRFFTDFCTQPLSLERWERALIQRLVEHVLPFRTREGEDFLRRYYFLLDRSVRDQDLPTAHRLDVSVGAANFIDNLLAREEAHHLVDYRICLGQIARILRARYPEVAPEHVPREAVVELYDRIGADAAVPGWNYAEYGDPRYFLELLRRHTVTGAFCHPRYGGNVGAAGWAYLQERYRDDAGATLFDWRPALAPQLGTSTEYRG